MTIGELAARFGLATHVLRHWESVGVLAAAERVNGRRRYLPEHVARVTMILRAKEAGLTLDHLRQVIAAPDADARRELLSSHHADLDRRMREIEMAKRMIEHALHCPEQDFTRCMVFQEIVTGVAEGTPAHTHADAPAVAPAAMPARERLARGRSRKPSGAAGAEPSELADTAA